MTPDHLAAELAGAIAPLADGEAAAAMRAYLRDVAPFLGVATPARRAATMPIIRALGRSPDRALVVGAAEQLWDRPEREHAYVAVDLLRRHYGVLVAGDLAAIRALVVRGAWWDTTDALAMVVDLMGRGDGRVDEVMEAWIDDCDPWVRRAAVLHQLGRGEGVDLDRLFRFCLRHASDPWFFMRKAIGWALRDASAAHPGAVAAFVADHAAELSPLTRREALRRLGGGGKVRHFS